MGVKVLIWLDDWREAEYYAPVFDGETVWVKSFQEFEKFIQERGIPHQVSFDYDLGKGSGFNGLSCAKVLLKKCIEEGKEFPHWHVHSTHPDKEELEKWIRGECKRKGFTDNELNKKSTS